jgi:hypothetical protein
LSPVGRAQLLEQTQVSSIGSVVVEPRRFDEPREPAQSGMIHKGCEAGAPDAPPPDVGVTVQARAQRSLRIIQVEGVQVF